MDWTTGLDCWTGLLDWTTGVDHWTGLLDWTTGELKINSMYHIFNIIHLTVEWYTGKWVELKPLNNRV